MLIPTKQRLDLIVGPVGDTFDRNSSGLFKVILRQLGMGQPDGPDSDVLEISLERAGGVLVSILILVVAYWFIKQLISGAKLCCLSRLHQHLKVKYLNGYIY